MSEEWTRLSVSDRCRVVIVALTVPCAVALALAVRPSPRQPTALFRGLAPADIATVREHLDRWGVPYAFQDGGHTVLVPAARRAEVIVELDRMAPESVPTVWASIRRPVTTPVPVHVPSADRPGQSTSQMMNETRAAPPEPRDLH
jgi:hypothetical protein